MPSTMVRMTEQDKMLCFVLRTQGLTYREISDKLKEEYGVFFSPQAIHTMFQSTINRPKAQQIRSRAVRSWLVENNMTEAKLAEAIGWKEEDLHEALHGSSNYIRADAAEAIADYTGIPVENIRPAAKRTHRNHTAAISVCRNIGDGDDDSELDDADELMMG